MADEHYFTADPQAAFKRVPVSANVWGHWLELTSGSGVFAQGRLDIGTGVLLREQAAPEGARSVLDLGCGYGVIGLAIAVAVPGCTVTAIDVNERAVLLANENAAALDIGDRFTACLPGEVDPAATYDEIWSNPRSGSARRRCTPCCSTGCLGWLRRGGPGSWSARTSARTRWPPG